MSIKQEAHEIVDQLPEDANWDDLVKSLYRNQKITLGMNDHQIEDGAPSEAEISNIFSRLNCASHVPEDARDTKKYSPGNSLTASWALVALAPLFFISIFLTPVAFVLALVGMVLGVKSMGKDVEHAWVPVVVGLVELILFIALPMAGSVGAG